MGARKCREVHSPASLAQRKSWSCLFGLAKSRSDLRSLYSSNAKRGSTVGCCIVTNQRSTLQTRSEPPKIFSIIIILLGAVLPPQGVAPPSGTTSTIFSSSPSSFLFASVNATYGNTSCILDNNNDNTNPPISSAAGNSISSL